MCGITGFFSIKPQPVSVVGRMTDTIRHRGPDDEGFVLFPSLELAPVVCAGPDTPVDVYQFAYAYAPTGLLCDLDAHVATLALGHRRLAIVDLSPMGHQPMSSADGRYWIVFNGEVYNHVELRLQLEACGHRFFSHSDTEVIIAAYREWGKDCLSRFNGMFAFLIYDREHGSLFAARDRFGIKPLYYRVSADGIAFASEIKQFIELPDWQAQVNGQRAYDFLNWGVTDHTDETLFAGVFQLRGGQALVLNLRAMVNGGFNFSAGDRLPVQRWYELKPQPFVGSLQEAAERFREKLVEAVKLHLRADVPVGSCLSGGLDSSSIVCIVNQLLGEQQAQALQKTFSACADVAKFDERHWIDKVVTATGVDAHYVYPALTHLFNEVPTITWHQDEPFGSTSIYAQWKVFRLASEQRVKVMLDGQGADEQLAGYHGYFGPRLATLFKSMRWVSLLKEATAMRRLHGYGYLSALAHIARFTLPGSLKEQLRRIFGQTSAQPSWLNCDQLGCKAVNPFQTMGHTNTVQGLSMTQLTTSNLQMLLHWEDRDSMGHSIESRVPFLDHRLVEFVLGLPDEYKLSAGVTKRVLRLGMSGMLPNSIRDRMDKLGFVTPEENWLRNDSPDLFRKKMNEAIVASNGLIREKEAQQMLEDTISGKLPFSFLPWRIISFGTWVQQFSVKI